MGAKAVGVLQYNENDLEEADVKVAVTNKVFTLDTVDDKQSNKKDQSEVRQRLNVVKEPNLHIQDLVINDEAVEDDNGKCQDKKISKTKNPINWFGILVPQALKQSQTRFKSATELVCSIASLKCEYVDLQEKYVRLLEQKTLMLNDNDDVEKEQ